MIARSNNIDYNAQWEPVIREAMKAVDDPETLQEIEGYLRAKGLKEGLNDPLVRSRIADLLDNTVTLAGGRAALLTERERLARARQDLSGVIAGVQRDIDHPSVRPELRDAFYDAEGKNVDAIQIGHRNDMEGIMREGLQAAEGAAEESTPDEINALYEGLGLPPKPAQKPSLYDQLNKPPPN